METTTKKKPNETHIKSLFLFEFTQLSFRHESDYNIVRAGGSFAVCHYTKYKIGKWLDELDYYTTLAGSKIAW